MSKNNAPLQIVTANALATGEVVYLAREGRWSSEIAEAALCHDAAEADALLAMAKESERKNTVTGAYLFAVEKQPQGIVASHIRERIRTTGPTVDIQSSVDWAGGRS